MTDSAEFSCPQRLVKGQEGLQESSRQRKSTQGCVCTCPMPVSLRSRFPDAPVMAAGYSLGSVLLAKYLAEADNGLYTPLHSTPNSSDPAGGASGSSVPELSKGSGLVAAALVSPPVCLHTTNSKMGRPYTMKFLYNLAVAYK